MGISFASEIMVVIATIAYIFDEISLSTAQSNPLKVLLLIVLLFAFIKIGHLIHRKWILHRFNEEAAILKQNVCAALVDSGMLIANCIITLSMTEVRVKLFQQTVRCVEGLECAQSCHLAQHSNLKSVRRHVVLDS